MEPNIKEQTTPLPSSTIPTIGICPVCHQPVISQYFFCPNCGTKLNSAPLSTTVQTQAWIYFFSIILPMLGFIFVGKWPGTKYYKSEDPKVKQIGQIAWALLLLSTIITIWLAIVWTQKTIQSSMNSLNIDMGTGGF